MKRAPQLASGSPACRKLWYIKRREGSSSRFLNWKGILEDTLWYFIYHTDTQVVFFQEWGPWGGHPLSMSIKYVERWLSGADLMLHVDSLFSYCSKGRGQRSVSHSMPSMESTFYYHWNRKNKPPCNAFYCIIESGTSTCFVNSIWLCKNFAVWIAYS